MFNYLTFCKKMFRKQNFIFKTGASAPYSEIFCQMLNRLTSHRKGRTLDIEPSTAYSFRSLSGIMPEFLDFIALFTGKFSKMFTHQIQMRLKSDSFIPLSKVRETIITPQLFLQKSLSDGVTSTESERAQSILKILIGVTKRQ